MRRRIPGTGLLYSDASGRPSAACHAGASIAEFAAEGTAVNQVTVNQVPRVFGGHLRPRALPTMILETDMAISSPRARTTASHSPRVPGDASRRSGSPCRPAIRRPGRLPLGCRGVARLRSVPATTRYRGLQPPSPCAHPDSSSGLRTPATVPAGGRRADIPVNG